MAFSPVSSPRTLIIRLTPFFLLALVYVVGMRQMLHTSFQGSCVRTSGRSGRLKSKPLLITRSCWSFPGRSTWSIRLRWGALNAVGLALLLVISCVVALWRICPSCSSRGRLVFIRAGSHVFVPLNVLVNEHRLYIPSAMFAIVWR